MSVILTRNMSLSLPAHPPGHLSPKIVCTSLAWILKLPLWGACPRSAWRPPGVRRNKPGVSGGPSAGRRWDEEALWPSPGSLWLRPLRGHGWASQPGGRGRQARPPASFTACSHGFWDFLGSWKGRPLGGRQACPGGSGRAAIYSWIPLLPFSGPLSEEGMAEFLAVVDLPRLPKSPASHPSR